MEEHESSREDRGLAGKDRSKRNNREAVEGDNSKGIKGTLQSERENAVNG